MTSGDGGRHREDGRLSRLVAYATIAGTAVALIALFAQLSAGSTPSPPDQTAAPTTTSTSPATTTSNSVTVPSQPPADLTEPVWTGSIRVSRGISLGGDSPESTSISASTLYYIGSQDRLGMSNSGSAAQWTSRTDPTLEQCKTLINAQPLSNGERGSLPIEEGIGFCMDEDGTVSFARITGRDGEAAVNMDAMIWRGQLS